MNENPKCKLCELNQNATPGSVCLKGEGGMKKGGLLIFLDSPDIVEDRRHRAACGEPANLLKWMLARMSLKPENYYIDYILKCHAKCKATNKKADRQHFVQLCSTYRFATLQKLHPNAIIGMGRLCSETFVGSDKVSNYEGTFWTPIEPRVRDFVEHVWITYSPAYALQDPAESVTIYRTLEAAANSAGFKTKLNPNIKPTHYDYGT